MLETPKKREAEVLRGLHKHPKFHLFLVIVFRQLACKSLALANEIYIFKPRSAANDGHETYLQNQEVR